MPPDSAILTLSLVLSVSALLAAAIGFLAIVQARRHRQLEQIVEERWRDMAHRVRTIEERLTPASLEGTHPKRPIKPASTRGTSVRMPRSSTPMPDGSLRSRESALITIPELAAVPNEAEGSLNDLKDRHATIWEMAEKGAAPEMIARTTGQPIGQVELILGLRRRIDQTKFAPRREPT